MILYIVRHGQTEWNVKHKFQGQANSELTQQGVDEAIMLGESLKDRNEKIDFIIASPLKRTMHTTQLINKSLNLDVEYDDRLMEISVGDFEGKIFEEEQKNYSDLFKTIRTYPYETPYPNGESIKDVFNRIKSFVDEIKGKYNDKNIMLVVHGVVIKCLYTYLKYGDIKDWDNTVVENLSVTKFNIEEDVNEELMYNNVIHKELSTN